jgi:hypothetical protein
MTFTRLAPAIASITLGACSSQPTMTPRTARPDPEWAAAIFIPAGGWSGGDCMGSVPLPGARVAWLAADSWIGPIDHGRHAPGSAMVNNAVGVHTVGNSPPSSIDWAWGPTPRPGVRSAWVMPPEPGTWCWNVGGGGVIPSIHGPDRLVVFLADIAPRNPAGDGIWNFRAVGTRVALVQNPSDPPGRWHIWHQRLLTALAREKGKIVWGNAVCTDARTTGPRHVAVFGLDPADPFHKRAVLARCDPDRIEDFASWRFWDGSGWSEAEADAAPVTPDVTDEFSVHRIMLDHQSVFVMIHAEPMLGPRILARTALTITGPWSEPRPVYTAPEPGRDSRLFAYAAKAHPELSSPGELLVTYCVNSQDFAHAASDAEVNRPRFLRVPLSLLPRPPSHAPAEPTHPSDQ